MQLLLLAALGGLASGVLTGRVRRYALARSLLDLPGHRSSHTTPTARGGGLAIAVITLAGVVLAGAWGILPNQVALAVVGGGLAIATVGWIDDRGGVSAAGRAVVHLASGGWLIFWLGGLPILRVGEARWELGLFGAVLATLGVAWLTNLYNFMDGIDGIAAGEAVFVGVMGGGMLLAEGHRGLALVALLVAGSSAGFLVWNWAPAKIFMGDVGSGLLGFLFGALAVASERTNAVPLTIWLLLLGTFVYDATVTLFRRALRGERWYAAHRSHAYQRATQAGLSHSRVTTAVMLINCALGLLAVWAWSVPSMLLPAALVGLGLLTLIYGRVERIRPM